MRADQILDRSCGFFVTPEGEAALQEAEEACDCTDLYVIDGCYQCVACGTIFGTTVGVAKMPRRNTWRRFAASRERMEQSFSRG